MRFQSKMICLRSESCKLTTELEIETIVSQSLVPYSHGQNVLCFFFFKDENTAVCSCCFASCAFNVIFTNANVLT